MKVKGLIVILIFSLAMMGFVSCDNGTTTRIEPPFPLTITELLEQAMADGITEGHTEAIGFGTLDRSLRFFYDGYLEVWSQGLGQAAQLNVSGRWVENTDDPFGNRIDVFARRDHTANIGTAANPNYISVEEGDILYSFRYIVVNPEIMRILQLIPGRWPVNINRSEGYQPTPPPNAQTVQLGEFSRMESVPYIRHP